jgi:hypothetical protein
MRARSLLARAAAAGRRAPLSRCGLLLHPTPAATAAPTASSTASSFLPMVKVTGSQGRPFSSALGRSAPSYVPYRVTAGFSLSTATRLFSSDKSKDAETGAASSTSAEAEVAPSSFSSSSSLPIATRNLVKFTKSGGASSFQGWSNEDVIVDGEGTIKNNDMPFVNRHEELWDLFRVNARNARMCAEAKTEPNDFRVFKLLFCVQVCWFASPMFSHRA